jgi:fatty acid kinase
MVAATEPASGLSVVRKPLREIDGQQMLTGLRSALTWLEANQQEINDLNVFPVPDGDTGSNMYLTLRSAVEEAQSAPVAGSADSVAAAAAHGSLMGARGNSGVILSQILRGLAQGLSGQASVSAAGIARALNEASSVAYRAVMKPTEGTILTVIRAAAAAAKTASVDQDDVRTVLESALSAAHAAVEGTTEQLAVLRDAGVVDAGGFGLAVILEGFTRALEQSDPALGAPRPPARRVGEPPVRLPQTDTETVTLEGRRGAAAVAPREEGWGYCTEFLLTGPGLDVDSLRDELGALGDSALVVGDSDLARVHIHTQDPAALIGVAARRGAMSKLKVEDMSAQHHDVLDRAAAADSDAADRAAAGPAKETGVVSVAPARGFRDILRSLGADEVVQGGQTMNPSIEDLLNGVRACNARGVVLLPNNGNVILTAQQVDALAGDIAVRVVPTKSLPQGIAALLAYDAAAGLDENCTRMEDAMRGVRGVEVTRAVRDSTSNGREIRTGDVIAIVDDEITEVGTEYLPVIDGVIGHAPVQPELVTVYRGEEVGADEAEELVGALRERHPSVEFELHEGGQEHYPYVLSLE